MHDPHDHPANRHQCAERVNQPQSTDPSCLRQYATFSGRARRSEYWYFQLFQILVGAAVTIVSFALLALAGAFGSDSGDSGGPVATLLLVVVILLYTAAYLGLLLPSLAVSWRRLHDTGRSGWWFLLASLPGLNIVVLVFSCLDSAPGPNQWGPNPKSTRGHTPTSGQFPPGPTGHPRNF